MIFQFSNDVLLSFLNNTHTLECRIIECIKINSNESNFRIKKLQINEITETTQYCNYLQKQPYRVGMDPNSYELWSYDLYNNFVTLFFFREIKLGFRAYLLHEM